VTAALRPLLVLLAGAHVLLFAFLVGRRLFWPYDLEWMEGGMVLQALRVAHGQPLYGPPTLDYVPFLYGPLYPALLATLGRAFGVSYALGRLISIASLAGALALGYAAARRAGAGRAVALAAMACVLTAFPLVGAWYDLARVDELYLLAMTAGVYLTVHWPRPAGAIVSALLLVAACFSKQTALPILVFAGVGWLLVSRRLAALYAAAAVVGLAAGVLVLDAASDGWFWIWCIRASTRHKFYRYAAFNEAPRALLTHAPAIWLALAAAVIVRIRLRRFSRAHLVWTALAVVGTAAALVASGKEWAASNCYIPAVFFPLLALAVLTAEAPSYVLSPSARRTPRFVLGTLVPAALAVQLATHFYDPRPFTPTTRDRQAAGRLLALLASAPGDVFVPYHPFYSELAGKRPHLHRMGMLDAQEAKLGRPAGLDAALAEGHFALVVLNRRAKLVEWPTLAWRYHLAEELVLGESTPRSFAGADTWPLSLYLPRPDGAVVVATPHFNSGKAGTGRSGHDIVIDQSHLAFDVAGSVDPNCRVDLVIGDRQVRTATGPGTDLPARIEWDVASLRGSHARIEIVDNSPAARLRVDEIWSLP
jgi:hypothetical protein